MERGKNPYFSRDFSIVSSASGRNKQSTNEADFSISLFSFACFLLHSDRAALTSLLYISTTLGDHRNSALASQVIKFLPDIFSMLELHDNQELSKTARAVLTKVSTYNFPSESVAPLVREILKIIRESTDSWRARLDALPVLQVVYFQK